MDNIYQSKFLEIAKNDEMKKGTELYNKSKKPIETGVVPVPAYSSMFTNIHSEINDNKYVTSLTGEKMKIEQFSHNNMQPFLKGNITQNTNIVDNTPRLDIHTGIDKFYIQKKKLKISSNQQMVLIIFTAIQYMMTIL